MPSILTYQTCQKMSTIIKQYYTNPGVRNPSVCPVIDLCDLSQVMVQGNRPEGVQSPMNAKACASASIGMNRMALGSRYWAAFIRSKVASMIPAFQGQC